MACVVLSVDAGSARDVSADRYHAPGHGPALEGADPAADPDLRALRHALAEHDLRTHRVVAGVPLGEQLAG